MDNKILFSIASLAIISTMPFAFADVMMSWGTGERPVIDEYSQNTDGTYTITYTLEKEGYGNLNDGSFRYYSGYDGNIRLLTHIGTETYTLDEDFPKFMGNCVILQINYSGGAGNSNQVICP